MAVMKTLILIMAISLAYASAQVKFSGRVNVTGRVNVGTPTPPPGFDWSALTHYWTLDESGGNSRLDSVGSLTLAEGAGVVQENTGSGAKHGQSADFESDPSKNLQTAILALTRPFSLSLWFNVGFATGEKSVIFKEDADHIVSSLSIYVGEDMGTPLLAIRGYNLIADPYISLNVWYHLVVTMAADDTSIIYLDGAELFSTSAALPDGPMNSLGGIVLGNSGYRSAVDGIVDEIALFNAVLTPAQVTALYNGGTGLFYP